MLDLNTLMGVCPPTDEIFFFGRIRMNSIKLSLGLAPKEL